MQFPSGYYDFLTNSIEICATRVLDLLEHPNIATKFGRAGIEKVRQHNLLPRLIRDELRLMQQLLER